MHIVRNCIDIVGITPESELPKKINGQIVETLEKENLFIKDNIEIKNIYQIIIDISIKGTRVINTPLNKIIVMDIIKKFKIAYYDMDNNMSILELDSPCNLFFNIENDKIEIEKTNIYIADAQFELVNNNTLYNYILFIMDVHYLGGFRKSGKINSFNEDTKNSDDDFDTSDNKDNDNKVVNHALKEVSIAEDNKIENNKDKQLNISLKNELLDMEDEYL